MSTCGADTIVTIRAGILDGYFTYFITCKYLTTFCVITNMQFNALHSKILKTISNGSLPELLCGYSQLEAEVTVLGSIHYHGAYLEIWL